MPASSCPSAQLLQDHVGLLLDEQQLEPREARVEAGHDVGQQVGRERGEQADAHGARLGVVGLVGDARMLSASLEDHPGPLDHPLAGVGEHDVARDCVR